MAKDPLDPSRCAKLLSALAAPERLKIVRFLADGAQNVTAIADMLRLKNVVNVSHHLAVLEAIYRHMARILDTLGRIEHLLQSFKVELTAAKDHATTQAERLLVTKYTLAQSHFDAGSNQMNVPLRLEAWVKATGALEDAEALYQAK